MPNWCKGVLKVRGKKKDLINFLNNGIERYGWPRDEEGEYTKYPLNAETDEFGDTFVNQTDKEHDSWLYFKDSRRCFIEDNINWYWDSSEDEELEEEYIQCLDIKQAWRLEPDYFKETSEKYNVDFRMKGFECGYCFTQEIEVIKGEITLNQVNSYKEYQEYQWNVYDPRLGG